MGHIEQGIRLPLTWLTPEHQQVMDEALAKAISARNTKIYTLIFAKRPYENYSKAFGAAISSRNLKI